MTETTSLLSTTPITNDSHHESIRMDDVPPPPDDKAELLEAAAKGEWATVENLIGHYTYDFFTRAVDRTGKTILHHACSQKKNQETTKAVKTMLEAITEPDHRAAFIDKGDMQKPETFPLQLAAIRKDKELVMLLIKNGADVNLPATRDSKNENENEALQIILNKIPNIYYNILELKWSCYEDNEDDICVEWDYSPVTGVLPYDKDESKSVLSLVSQTAVLTSALHAKKINRKKVLRDPLVQMFLHYKREAFQFWIGVSMTFHIFWSIISILFLASYGHFPESKPGNNNGNSNPCTCPQDQLNFTETKESSSSTESVEEIEINYADNLGLAVWHRVEYVIPIITLFFFVFTLIKEYLERKGCPSRKYYWKQQENIGQWIVIFSIPLVFGLHHLEPYVGIFAQPIVVFFANIIATVGIFIAGLLVLGQFNKTELLGIYMEMLVKVVRNIFKFFLFFSPLILTFAIIFRLLMPDRDEFHKPYVVKVVAMMTGEIGYDDVFHDDDKGPVPLPFVTQLVFLFFIVTVIIVLQNLLIGLTLSEIQELKQKAKENDTAKQLEQLYLIESFLLAPTIKTWFIRFGKEARLKSLMVDTIGKKKFDELPEKLQQVISESDKAKSKTDNNLNSDN